MSQVSGAFIGVMAMAQCLLWWTPDLHTDMRSMKKAEQGAIKILNTNLQM